MSALTLSNVTLKRGDRTIVGAIGLTFAAGKLTAVIGPNGAGKSTLLEAAAGLLPPSHGSIRLGGDELAAIGRRKLAERRAYLPQRASVEWPISVERVVALGLLPQLPAFGTLPAALMPAIDGALEDCDLLALREREATSLSGGELARVMLARAIVGDPELLIVDEPTAGLDPRHAIDAARRLRLRADAGRTVVMAIHDLDIALRVADEIVALRVADEIVALRVADEIVALRDGKLLAAGPVETVLTEAMLADLYDVRVRIVRDDEGAVIRFLD